MRWGRFRVIKHMYGKMYTSVFWLRFYKMLCQEIIIKFFIFLLHCVSLTPIWCFAHRCTINIYYVKYNFYHLALWIVYVSFFLIGKGLCYFKKGLCCFQISPSFKCVYLCGIELFPFVIVPLWEKLAIKASSREKVLFQIHLI